MAEESDRPDVEWARRLAPDDGLGMNLPLVAEVEAKPWDLLGDGSCFPALNSRPCTKCG